MELEVNCPKRWFQKPDMQENSRFLSGRQRFENKQINKQASLKQEKACLLLDSERRNTDIMWDAQILCVNVFFKADKRFSEIKNYKCEITFQLEYG